MPHRQVTVLSWAVAIQAIIYGYLKLTMDNPPYGDIERYLAYLSFLVAFVVLWGQFAFIKKLHPF